MAASASDAETLGAIDQLGRSSDSEGEDPRLDDLLDRFDDAEPRSPRHAAQQVRARVARAVQKGLRKRKVAAASPAQLSAEPMPSFSTLATEHQLTAEAVAKLAFGASSNKSQVAICERFGVYASLAHHVGATTLFRYAFQARCLVVRG